MVNFWLIPICNSQQPGYEFNPLIWPILLGQDTDLISELHCTTVTSNATSLFVRGEEHISRFRWQQLLSASLPPRRPLRPVEKSEDLRARFSDIPSRGVTISALDPGLTCIAIPIPNPRRQIKSLFITAIEV